MRYPCNEKEWFEKNPPPQQVRITKYTNTLGTVFLALDQYENEPRVDKALIRL